MIDRNLPPSHHLIKNMHNLPQKLLSQFIYLLSALVGLIAFFYPFFLPQIQTPEFQAMRGGEAPLLTVILLILCLAVMVLEVQGEAVSAKMVATLGVLVAVTSILRFIEVAIPAPGGFSPIFAPIILAGFVFGGRFGFLMGVMTLLTSALITGTVGPWLPYQMFTAGWVGLTAGWIPKFKDLRISFLFLLIFGFGWGLLYGALMNLYFWPFVAGDPANSWETGLSLRAGLARYSAFYLLTSLVWDLARSVGNVLLLLALGMPAIRALTRFKNRF
ncbi:MAG: energy-coupling factor transport system substrate-specific component, partial [Candidatus Promineifilaceae bacterium]